MKTRTRILFPLAILAVSMNWGLANLVPISPGIINSDNCHTYFLLPSSNWTDAEAAAVEVGVISSP